MDDAKRVELGKSVRALMRSGKLPHAPRHIYGGTASGEQTCAVCGLPIEKGRVVFELDLDEQERRTTLFTHADCYTAWHQETIRARLESGK